MSDIYRNGMYGLIVGDALGVPVEFKNRHAIKMNPVVGMRAFGTHNQPVGTWSDDSSMALATLDSIREKNGLDYEDIMNRFVSWYRQGAYTPFDELFDIGMATTRAINNYENGAKPLESGVKNEWDNGNGSLMRILPVCLHLFERQKQICTSEDESIYHIHAASALTHAHLRSQLACGIFYFCVKAIIEGEGTLYSSLEKGLNNAFSYYRKDFANNAELENYKRLMDLAEFRNVPEEEIEGSGYVVATLEAAIWCLINTDTYADAVLKAVNLGDDTDTVGAVTGALAGLYYGVESIPEEWMEAIQRKEFIEEILAK